NAAGTTRLGFVTVDKHGKAIDKQFDNVLSGVSSTGYIAYLSKSSFVIENLTTGQRTAFSAKDYDGHSVQWSPDSKYGLLFGSYVWLIEPERGVITPLQSKFVAPLEDPLGRPQPLWSPDSKQALYVSNGMLYHLQADTGQLTALPINANDRSSSLRWNWT